MTTDEFKRYKEALSKKLAELSETLANRRPIAIEFTPEACERIVLTAQRELAVLTLDRHSRFLREVKAARRSHADVSMLRSADAPMQAIRTFTGAAAVSA